MYGAAVQHSTWRLDGMVLPDGEAVETHWVVAGLFTTTAPNEKDVPNLPGRYVLPGSVDAHAHVTIDYTGARRPHGDADVVSTNLSRAVHSGVLDLRDLGAPTGHKAPQGGGDSPHVHAVGPFLAPAGRYVPSFCDGTAPELLVSAALAELAAGSSWVKVIADFPDMAALRAGDVKSLFKPDTNHDAAVMAATIQAVHAQGGRVAAHSTGPFVCDLVRLGVDSLEHGLGLDEEALKLMAARGTAWTPTLTSLTTLADSLGGDRGSPLWALVNEQLERWAQLLPLAARLGVVLLAGTDDVPHGTVPAEIRNLVRFGVEPSVALAAGTTAARRFLGYHELVDGAPASSSPTVTTPATTRRCSITLPRCPERPTAAIRAVALAALGRIGDGRPHSRAAAGDRCPRPTGVAAFPCPPHGLDQRIPEWVTGIETS